MKPVRKQKKKHSCHTPTGPLVSTFDWRNLLAAGGDLKGSAEAGEAGSAGPAVDVVALLGARRLFLAVSAMSWLREEGERLLELMAREAEGEGRGA